MSAGAPKPLITTLAPAPAKARAIARPMPLVEPVTTAFLPVSVPILPSLLFADGGFVPRQIVGHHGFPGLWPFQPLLVTHRQMHVTNARVPVLGHGEVGKIVVLRRGLVVLALVDQVHHRDGVFPRRLAQEVYRWIVLQALRQPANEIMYRPAGVVDLPVLVGVHSRAAGIADIFLALGRFQQRLG